MEGLDMVLKSIVNQLLDIAAAQPSVNSTAEGSVYDVLNSGGSAEKYAAFVAYPENVTVSGDEYEATIVMFYVDRLREDRSNRLEVQSNAIDTLHNIISSWGGEWELTESYTPFTERFADVCAGAYVRVTVTVPISECNEDFGG